MFCISQIIDYCRQCLGSNTSQHTALNQSNTSRSCPTVFWDSEHSSSSQNENSSDLSGEYFSNSSSKYERTERKGLLSSSSNIFFERVLLCPPDTQYFIPPRSVSLKRSTRNHEYSLRNPQNYQTKQSIFPLKLEEAAQLYEKYKRIALREKKYSSNNLQTNLVRSRSEGDLENVLPAFSPQNKNFTSKSFGEFPYFLYEEDLAPLPRNRTESLT